VIDQPDPLLRDGLRSADWLEVRVCHDRRRALALLVLAAGLSASRGAADEPVPGRDWPIFRGLRSSGVSEGSAPLEFDVPSGRGVLWRVPVPGLGHSSPVVWNDRVCLLTAVGPKDPSLRVGLYGDIAPVDDEGVHEFQARCHHKRDGRLLWETTLRRAAPAIKRHPKASHANSTAATDGRVLMALLGSEGLHALDLASGRLLWSKDLGRLDSGFFMAPEAQWGFGSSPILVDGAAIVQADVQRGSFLAAFDLADGKERWRTPRADVPTWSTPAVYEAGGRRRLAVNGFKQIGGYDAATGAEVWRMAGGGDIPVPTPVVAHGLIFFTNAHGGSAPIWAVRQSASGDVSLPASATANDHVAWSQARDGAYMQTPLVVGDVLYVCRDNGSLGAYDARTGRRHFLERLGDGVAGFTASGVAAGARLYYTSEEGEVLVVRAGTRFEPLARSRLGEVAMATPAISEGVIYFRTRGHLVAVAEPAGAAPKPGAR
jgi:outer membrane protein assembly factor BamB